MQLDISLNIQTVPFCLTRKFKSLDYSIKEKLEDNNEIEEKRKEIRTKQHQQNTRIKEIVNNSTKRTEDRQKQAQTKRK